MFTPKFRDMILEKRPLNDGSMFQLNNNFSDTLRSMITSKQIIPYFTSSNIFSFDRNLAKDPRDIEKLNECIDYQSYQQETATGTNSNTWIWALIALLFLIILASILYRNRRM
jgi:hypothetical protein